MLNGDSVNRILVQLADRRWTLEATHLACQLARVLGAEIVFIKMVPVQHIEWLGTELGYRDFTAEDYENLEDYAATAEDYSVPCSVHRYQYITFPEGICDVTEIYGTQLVFAKPIHKIKFIRQIQSRLLRAALTRQNRQLADDTLVQAILLASCTELAADLHGVKLTL